LEDKIDASVAMRAWESALATEWPRKPVWIHGDMSAGNLLLRDGRLGAVIDFGLMAVGDPACDLAIAWSFLTEETRPVLRSALQIDDATWERGRGWALWKASIVAAGIVRTNAVEESSLGERSRKSWRRCDVKVRWRRRDFLATRPFRAWVRCGFINVGV
jgi:aminoglycoside phosphotransferase (APT) family kinase protein